MTMHTEDGRLIVIGGSSRSGKTAWTKKAVARTRRIAAWDPEDQWAQLPGWKKVTTRKALAEALTKKGPVKVAFVAGGKLQEEFNFWAECVMYAGRYVEPLSCIAEELADVTTPGKAPEKWGILVRRGLKRGITIYAISQRWAEADKTAVGNASEFILFRQSSGDDIAYLAKKTRVTYEDLDGLEPLEYVQKCAITGNLQRGKLKF
jgi:hypothetical protein